MVDALRRLPNQVEPIGAPNQTIDVHFITKVVTKCLWLLVKRNDAKKIYNFTTTIFSL